MKEKKDNNTPDRWAKDLIVKSNRYVHDRDVVTAVLEDGQEYTINEVDELVRKYREGGAN